MKNVFTILTILILSSAFSLNAQNPKRTGQSVTGIILDANTEVPMEFATIAILNTLDSSVITGGLSDSEGKFDLDFNAENVFVKIDFISFESFSSDPLIFLNNHADLGKIFLSTASENLEQIEIIGEKSENRFALDKRVFTVGKDLANKGGTAEDILDNVPSVSVDIDGNVSLRGSEGVRILIDGRPSGLAGLGNTNGLRNIASNVIEQIEVITNPSARYEAEGMAGIINIILKKNKSEGFNGSFDLTGGYPLSTGASANINYRKNKLNWFFNYGLRYRENPGGGFLTQDQLNVSEDASETFRQISVQDRNQNRTGLSNSFRFGADYFINDKEQITAAFLFRKSDEDNFSTINYSDYFGELNAFSEEFLWLEDGIENWNKNDYINFQNKLDDNTILSQTQRTDEEIEDEKNLEYSLNYEKQFSSREHKLAASVQFNEKSETESSLYTNKELYDPVNFPDFTQRSNNAESNQTWLFQLDYVHPLGKDHKYELGLRSSLRDIKNDFLVEDLFGNNWLPIDGLSNNFLYDEDVQAAYAIYGNTINKFGFQAGIRSEYSVINTRLVQSEIGGENNRDFLNLFPSGHINYNFSEKSALQLSYSRRINRPGFWDLNPFFTFSDNRNFFSGNPNVNPEFTDSYDLGQILYFDVLTFSGSFFYRKTTGSIQRILTVDNLNSNTLRMPLNIGTENDYGLDISANYTGLDWLKLDGNVNIFRNQLSLDQTETFDAVFNYYQVVRNFTGTKDEFNGLYGFDLDETDNITWNGRLTARLSFWNSDFQLRSNYRGARKTAQGSTNPILTVDLGWSKDFLDNHLTITLGVRDLFNNRKRNGTTNLDEFFQYSEFQWRSRTTTLTASYRINQKKKSERGGGQQEGGFEDGEF